MDMDMDVFRSEWDSATAGETLGITPIIAPFMEAGAILTMLGVLTPITTALDMGMAEDMATVMADITQE